jgi:hypothetical protein
MSYEELDTRQRRVYEGIFGGSDPPGASQWTNAARDRR